MRVSRRDYRWQATARALGPLAAVLLPGAPLLRGLHGAAKDGSQSMITFIGFQWVPGSPMAPPRGDAPLPRGSECPRAKAGGADSAGSAAVLASAIGLACGAFAAVSSARRRIRLNGTYGIQFQEERKGIPGVDLPGFFQTDEFWDKHPADTNEEIIFTTEEKYPGTSMTKEELNEYLAKKIESLKEVAPQTELEWEEEFAELEWEWGRHLLPYKSFRHMRLKRHKKKTIMKDPEFFRNYKLFKPLVVKHPRQALRLTDRVPSNQDRRLTINPEGIFEIERQAGFTYEEFTTSMAEALNNRVKPKKGDILQGIVVIADEKGALVEVGTKTWAFVPLKFCSLKPIRNALEVFTPGDQVQGEVISILHDSVIEGDQKPKQIIMGLITAETEQAWENVDALMKGAGNPILPVTVMSMKAWGAVVMTEIGLEGAILNRSLGDKVGDSSLVGTTVSCSINKVVRDIAPSDSPIKGPFDYPLLLEYRSSAAMDLAGKLQEGQVVDAKVVKIMPVEIDVEVESTRLKLRKMDVSRDPSFDMEDIFDEGEMIKCAIISVLQKSGEIRLSTRILETKKGMMIRDKAKVFELAEETARKNFERVNREKEKMMAAVGKTLNLGVEEPKASDKPKSTNIDVLGDDEAEGDF